MKEDGEYKEGGEQEEAPTQNKRSQRCGLGDVGNEADTRELLSTQYKKDHDVHFCVEIDRKSCDEVSCICLFTF